jgi:hypothetical protein
MWCPFIALPVSRLAVDKDVRASLNVWTWRSAGMARAFVSHTGRWLTHLAPPPQHQLPRYLGDHAGKDPVAD